MAFVYLEQCDTSGERAREPDVPQRGGQLPIHLLSVEAADHWG